jgi:hypothetical protein
VTETEADEPVVPFTPLRLIAQLTPAVAANATIIDVIGGPFSVRPVIGTLAVAVWQVSVAA